MQLSLFIIGSLIGNCNGARKPVRVSRKCRETRECKMFIFVSNFRNLLTCVNGNFSCCVFLFNTPTCLSIFLKGKAYSTYTYIDKVKLK